MRRVRHGLGLASAVGLLAVALAGCQTAEEGLAAAGIWAPPPEASAPPPVAPTLTVQNPDDVKYYPSDEPLRMGVEHFSRGNYGIAEHYFRDATEKAHKDPDAWLGLAASYDRLRRFDLADRAYAQVIRLTGETVRVLNNQGYSYMLRGNYTRARERFLRASRIEPGNPTIINNLQLLDSSSRFVNRSPDP
jgi:Flp pilus assembly protein TadD